MPSAQIASRVADAAADYDHPEDFEARLLAAVDQSNSTAVGTNRTVLMSELGGQIPVAQPPAPRGQTQVQPRRSDPSFKIIGLVLAAAAALLLPYAPRIVARLRGKDAEDAKKLAFADED